MNDSVIEARYDVVHQMLVNVFGPAMGWPVEITTHVYALHWALMWDVQNHKAEVDWWAD